MRGSAASSDLSAEKSKSTGLETASASASAAVGRAAHSGGGGEQQAAHASHAPAAKRVAAPPPPSCGDGATNLLASAEWLQAAAPASSVSIGSFEQRLKDAVGKKRAARERRRHHLVHHQRREQRGNDSRLQASVTSQSSLAKTKTNNTSHMSRACPSLGSCDSKSTSYQESRDLSNICALDKSALVRAIDSPSGGRTRQQKTLEDANHSTFKNKSSSSSSNSSNKQQQHLGNQAQSYVAPSSWAWIRQTFSADPPAAPRHDQSTHGRPRAKQASSQSARYKSHRSRRLNSLIKQSLVSIAMPPQLARSPWHSERLATAAAAAVAAGRGTTKSVCVKSTVSSSMRGLDDAHVARSSTVRIGESRNYASNITRAPAYPDQCSPLVSPAKVADAAEAAPTIDEKRADERVTPADAGDDAQKNVDGGYAWVILIVVFIINASTYGTARAYGLIFEKLARENEQSRTDAAMPFTIMGAVENMAGPLSGLLLALTRSWRLTVFSGSCMITLAHLLAGVWSDSQLGQLLAMGLMCGLGLSFVSISFFQVNNAYFVRYRNTAFGVGMTGAAFGTLVISPLCQYFLDNYEGTRMCYLMLGVIIAPNVPLALLLRPKSATRRRQSATTSPSLSSISSSSSSLSLASPSSLSSASDLEGEGQKSLEGDQVIIRTISAQVSAAANSDDDDGAREGRYQRWRRRRRRRRHRDSLADIDVWASVKRVVANPLFHLIWPTQLLFCWFNFVFGMIIVDFGKDRGMGAEDVARLVPCWAFGQLVGRLLLSSLVDLKFLTYRSFTVICFFAIGATTLLLNNTILDTDLEGAASAHTRAEEIIIKLQPDATQRSHLMLILIFVLSMFIALLYILLNGLVVRYVEPALQPLSIGISSFTGSFFLLPRANIIGYYRDTTGNYDAMLRMFTCVSLAAALVWLIVPPLCKYLKDLYRALYMDRSRGMSRKSIESTTRPYSTWQLNQQQHHHHRQEQLRNAHQHSPA